MSVPDTETLKKILRELMQLVREVQAFIPNNGARSDAPKVPGRAEVMPLPPPKILRPNDIKLPHPPGSAKACVLCWKWMANIVFYPCMHCVICQDCWKQSYALSGKDGRTSAFVRPDSRGCPAKQCTTKIQYALSLRQYTENHREDEVHYSQKNEYLGDSTALV